MVELPSRAQLWSDFDGTAVEHFGLLDSRNWLKSDLPLMPGYVDFLHGVQAEGVEIGGIITRRAELFRGNATMKSVIDHGLDEFFGDWGQVQHAGSEKAKAQFIVQRSRDTKIGVLEDRPYKAGRALISQLQMSTWNDKIYRDIVLGVAPHRRAPQRISRLAAVIPTFAGQVSVEKTEGSLSITGMMFGLKVVPIESYSEDSGKEFAQAVLDG